MRCRSHKEDKNGNNIYSEDDLNIQEIEAYAWKTADIRQKVLIMPENFLKGVGESAEPFAAGY